MNSSGLTQEQTEALANFQAITECWDNSIALQLMKRHNWDVTVASNEFFSLLSEEAHLQERHNSDRPAPRKKSPSRLNQQNNAQPAPSQIQPNWSIRSIISSGASAIYSKASTLVWNFWNLFVPPEVRGEESASARAFVTTLQNLKTPLIPPFSTRHLPDILLDTASIKRPLIIYINSRNVPTEYLRDIICHEVTTAYITEGYLAWGVDENSQDGKMVIRLLQATTLPTLAVLKVRDPAKPQVIDRLEGCVPFDTFLEFLDKNSSLLRPHQKAPEVSQRLLQERIIREQQDRELEEAERIVRERYKAEEIKKAQMKKEEEEEMKKQMIEEEKRKQKEESIGAEPNPGPDIAAINFRMPDGKKIERRFQKDKKIEILYDYIETSGLKNFDILTNFPSKVLDEKQVTLEAAGLFPKSVVYVRDNS
ncbi:unnamed protein product [Blepharisma stoltei]|uniref:UBX domain-containing protein n=1 Tax=Blepharisma stoltei TaxID=1481888 RepID=A0AAU9K2K2_9CILI|nr:unnamed protein product [Blepharisma stoltei]